MNRRVVITGMGAVTPLGVGVNNYFEALKKGTSSVDYITRFDTEKFDTKIAAEIKDFDVNQFLDKKEAKRMDRFTQYAAVATKEAMEQSGINLDQIDKTRFGVIVGSGVGGMETFENQHQILMEKGPGRVSPFFIPMMITNIAAGHVSIMYGAQGPNETVITACATGTNAIGDAFKIIQRDDADIMIAGGSEASITPLAIAGFNSMKALSTRNAEPQKASRPFDSDRDGFVMGEGAGIVILEELEHALKRGAKIYGEIVGYGMTADAHHITAPAPNGEGAARAMLKAIKDAKIKPEEVDYINAHGTSTDYNDKFETAAIKSVFSDHAYKLAVSSTKSMTGHLLGAAGAVEALACLMAINEGVIPPTINYTTPDPECDLDYVPNQARISKVDVAMSNSLGFGGHNASIVIKKYK